jgi:DMSO reductase family type II enzyme heme b subunit
MRKLLFTTLVTTLLTACGDSKQQQPASEPTAPAEKPAVVIDNTPVEALAIGGTLVALNTDSSLADPENAGWRDAQEYRLDLMLAPPVHQSINLRHDANAPPRPVFLRAASDGENMYLRMRWSDATENGTSGRTEFADAAAVQFALDAGASTSFMMGAANGPVNIWYWKASEAGAQNLAAGGFGSTTSLETAGLSSSSVYRDNGEWVIVFSRPIQARGDHQVALANGSANMAFALWEGDNKQRDGLKHVTMGWVTLQSASEGPAS